ncbi:MAG: TIGR03435 family protein, partial [Edaphobacter sp.]
GMVGAAQVPVTQASAGGASAGEKHLAFEVISIRGSDRASRPQVGPTPDGFHAINLPTFAIFQLAYAPSNESGPLRGDRIVGAPSWVMGSERYDVVAKVDDADLADWKKPDLQRTMLRTMLQAMLADRFKVVVHRESKEMPVYELVMAKSGPKFKQAETVETDALKQKYPNGGRITGGGLAVHGLDGTQFYGVTMAWLGQMILSTAAGRPVVDKTGLIGRYDLALPSSGVPPPGTSQLPDARSPRDAPSPPDALPPPDGDGESIFTVLPKALGLRLAPAKEQVETLVIDHVERPTEN